MTETIVALPSTKTSPLLTPASLVQTGKLVASGLKRESRIELITLEFDAVPSASVFVYPAIGFRINASDMGELDERIVNGCAIYGREFRELASEELDRRFLEIIRGEKLISTFDRDYAVRQVKLIEHAYNVEAYEFLRDIIKDIPGK